MPHRSAWQPPPEEKKPHKEGELYKVLTAFGREFALYYGYYEDIDRHSKYAEPTEIYPDFIKHPIFTEDGYPFVTAIQNPCAHYKKERNTTDKCVDCIYFKKGEELFGLCTCPQNQRNQTE